MGGSSSTLELIAVQEQQLQLEGSQRREGNRNGEEAAGATQERLGRLAMMGARAADSSNIKQKIGFDSETVVV